MTTEVVTTAAGDEPKKKWLLKEMSQTHKMAMSLMAQSVPRTKIAEICDITPEYVTMLAAQPICQKYLREMSAYADARLEAMSESAVDVIADVLQNGSGEERLKAARLQLEATSRIGANKRKPRDMEDEDEHLHDLAHRLEQLLKGKRGETIDVTPTVLADPSES